MQNTNGDRRIQKPTFTNLLHVFQVKQKIWHYLKNVYINYKML